MKFKIYFIILILILGCNSSNDKNITNEIIVDDLGNKFVFTTKPQRIISLAPNITEMIFELKLDKYLVGNTFYCNYPEKAKHIEKVGDMLTFNFEKILSLKPDLIFITVEGNTKDSYDKFKELGLKVFVSNPRNYQGIKKTYKDIGKIFSVNTSQTIQSWDSTINKIKSESSYLKKSAMYVVELSPLMIVGPNTFLNEYLTICGLKNIAEDSPLNYPIYSREEVLKRNPDYIIYPTDGKAKLDEIKLTYPEWENLSAIKNGNVIFVNRDLHMRPGPRFVDAVIDLFNQVRQKEAVVQSRQQ